ncbi:MAG: class I SAM-dependent methyltransferase [Candidatus Saccharimonadales bacterium]
MSKRASDRSVVNRHLTKYGIAEMVRVLSKHQLEGVVIAHNLRVVDGYNTVRYRLQRLVFYNSAAVMNLYLAKRPLMVFEQKNNLARKFLYSLPSFVKWASLMEDQGSLAMGPLHNPEIRYLVSGERIGPITRRLFRHGADSVGVRSRTITAGWLASHYISNNPRLPIKWLSLAGGSAIHAMFMINASAVDKQLLEFVDIDINPKAIELAEKITQLAGLNRAKTQIVLGNIFDEQLLETVGCTDGIDIVDMLGILDYLDETQAEALVRLAYNRLKPDGLILTSNMRPSHPQFDLHKRGVGWPGVITKTVHQIIAICQAAGVPLDLIDIYQPSDGVYNVVRLRKGRAKCI